MTILDRQMIARILALPSFDERDRKGRRTRLADPNEHDGWQEIRMRWDETPLREEWWPQ